MFVTNANRKVAMCPHCQHSILQSDGYRYYLGRLLHDTCYDTFVQKWHREHLNLVGKK